MIDLRPRDHVEDLAATVRSWAVRNCEATTSLGQDSPAASLQLWEHADRDLGLSTLTLPESHGGSGASPSDAAVVAAELGRVVAPLAFPQHLALVEVLTRAAVGTEGLADLLAPARGVVLGLPADCGPGAVFSPSVRTKDDDSLHGLVRAVVSLGAPTELVMPVMGPTGPLLVLARCDQAEAEITLDQTRPRWTVLFEGAKIDSILARGENVQRHLDRGLVTGATVLCAEQSGLARACLEATVDYVRERRQFGRAIGSFQAVKHRMADLWATTIAAEAAATFVAAALDVGEPPSAETIHIASVRCSDAAVKAAEERVQLHGGIAMTWEDSAHLFMKRAKSDQVAFGTPGHHLQRLAVELDLAGER